LLLDEAVDEGAPFLGCKVNFWMLVGLGFRTGRIDKNAVSQRHHLRPVCSTG
jgi:hypothetical protein